MINKKNLAVVFTEQWNCDIIIKCTEKAYGNGSGPVAGTDFKPVAAQRPCAGCVRLAHIPATSFNNK